MSRIVVAGQPIGSIAQQIAGQVHQTRERVRRCIRNRHHRQAVQHGVGAACVFTRVHRPIVNDTGLPQIGSGLRLQHVHGQRDIRARMVRHLRNCQNPERREQIRCQHVRRPHRKPSLLKKANHRTQRLVLAGRHGPGKNRQQGRCLRVHRAQIKLWPVNGSAKTDLGHARSFERGQQGAQLFNSKGNVRGQPLRRLPLKRADQGPG